ncbi:hypothetical protein L3X38_000046 [Prunus dulcis]|uniref:Uncharacterized protein n=1 Tax=Prunus dulcis TaxID=3755 RepID=A0AAD4USU2_PRUDU|nr:hypothetical protein L3X38_000046 [Prunus dulcis]
MARPMVRNVGPLSVPKMLTAQNLMAWCSRARGLCTNTGRPTLCWVVAQVAVNQHISQVNGRIFLTLGPYPRNLLSVAMTKLLAYGLLRQFQHGTSFQVFLKGTSSSHISKLWTVHSHYLLSADRSNSTPDTVVVASNPWNASDAFPLFGRKDDLHRDIFLPQAREHLPIVQGSVEGDILAPWVYDEASSEFHLLGPRLKGGMPQRLVNPSKGRDGRPFFFP